MARTPFRRRRAASASAATESASSSSTSMVGDGGGAFPPGSRPLDGPSTPAVDARSPGAPPSPFSRAEGGGNGLEQSSIPSSASASSLSRPRSAAAASTSTAAALLAQLEAAIARREAKSPSSSLNREDVESLWREDRRLLAAAVAAVEASLSEAKPSPPSAPTPTTPGLFQRMSRRARPPSSEPTPPPRELEFYDADEGASPPSLDDEGEDVLSLPVASWLKKHEPLVAEAASASAEARTFDAESAILALCEREGISAQKLAEQCSSISPSSKRAESSTSARAPPRRPPLGFDVAEALDRARELRFALSNLAEDADGDAPGFVTAADTDDLRVRYRHAKGSTVHTVRFEATLSAPLEHVLALCSEIDLSPGWNRFVVEAAVVAREAPFCSHYYAAQWSPRPFKEFDSAVKIRGHDAYDSPAAGAVICLESWPPKGRDDGGPFAPELPASASRRHRVLIHPGSCIVLSPIRPCPRTGKPRTRGTLLVTIDPVLPFVPAFLVAWVLRVLAPSIKRGIDSVMACWFSDGGGDAREDPRTSEMASEMRRRLVARPELYELAKRLVERHAGERAGGLPASPERRAARASGGGGVGGLLRRRTSSSGIAAGPVAAAVDGAIERLSRVSAEVVERAAASAVSAAAAAAERQQQRPEGGEQEGWISWLTWPLSAATGYAWSFFYPPASDSEEAR